MPELSAKFLIEEGLDELWCEVTGCDAVDYLSIPSNMYVWWEDRNIPDTSQWESDEYWEESDDRYGYPLDFVPPASSIRDRLEDYREDYREDIYGYLPKVLNPDIMSSKNCLDVWIKDMVNLGSHPVGNS
jgi:hypothetical protein